MPTKRPFATNTSPSMKVGPNIGGPIGAAGESGNAVVAGQPVPGAQPPSGFDRFTSGKPSLPSGAKTPHSSRGPSMGKAPRGDLKQPIQQSHAGPKKRSFSGKKV